MYSTHGKINNAFTILAGKLKGRGHVNDLGIGRGLRIILK
jgi:hypothetical protein